MHQGVSWVLLKSGQLVRRLRHCACEFRRSQACAGFPRSTATRRLVLVPCSVGGTPWSVNDREQNTPESDSGLPATVPAEGIIPTWVDRSTSGHLASSVEQQPTQVVTASQPDRVPSWSEPEPVQKAHHSRMCVAFREALRGLDQIDVPHFFSVRAVVMKSPPKFDRGAHSESLRIALREVEEGFQAQNEERQSRGWKLFFRLPRMLLFQPHRGGLNPKATVARQIRAPPARFMDGVVD